MTRCVVIVLDSGRIGVLRDASCGNRARANTIGNVAAHFGGVTLPNFERFDSGCPSNNCGVIARDEPAARVARLGASFKSKDAITGHWEMAGIHTVVPIPTYPDGFPPGIVEGSVAASRLGSLRNAAPLALPGFSNR